MANHHLAVGKIQEASCVLKGFLLWVQNWMKAGQVEHVDSIKAVILSELLIIKNEYLMTKSQIPLPSE